MTYEKGSKIMSYSVRMCGYNCNMDIVGRIKNTKNTVCYTKCNSVDMVV